MEANYRISLKNEVKRLQIKLMNQIIIGLECGALNPCESELDNLRDMFGDVERRMY